MKREVSRMVSGTAARRKSHPPSPYRFQAKHKERSKDVSISKSQASTRIRLRGRVATGLVAVRADARCLAGARTQNKSWRYLRIFEISRAGPILSPCSVGRILNVKAFLPWVECTPQGL